MTKLYWTDGPWPGKVALSSRPRGEDWLADDIANWRRQGIDTVFSLLTPQEESDLGLKNEAKNVTAQGMQFLSFPIPDREVPTSNASAGSALEKLDNDLSLGKNVLIHCRQGIGRTGLMAAALLVTKGLSPATAVKALSEARGLSVPETAEQREWIDHYAAILANAK